MITIANASRQHHKFHYREPGRKQASFVMIPSGTQRQIGQHFSASDTADVVEQLERAGARSRSAMLAKPDPRFKGLVYSTDKALSEDDLLQTSERAIEGAEITSARESLKSALGADEAINGKRGSRRSKETVVQVEARTEEGKKIVGGIDMSVTVAPEGRDLRLPG